MQNMIRLATAADIPAIVQMMKDMQDEVQDFDLNTEVTQKVLEERLAREVTWHLFEDEDKNIFGACHTQSLHNYWRQGKRFHLGGFYIKPSHRKQGRFKDVYGKLAAWVKEQGGVQIFTFITDDNDQSVGAFTAVGGELQRDLFYCRHTL